MLFLFTIRCCPTLMTTHRAETQFCHLYQWFVQNFILLILLGLILANDGRVKRASRLSCEASLTTVMPGKFCPKDPDFLRRRAGILGCESVQQNCTEPENFQYHCVLNEYGNQTVEVCAIVTKIVGYACAEFNIGGEFIQEHYTSPATCSKCPFMYRSTDAYKYEECYIHIKHFETSTSLYVTTKDIFPATFTILSTTENMKNKSLEESMKSGGNVLPAVITATVFVVILIIITITFYLRRRIRFNNNHSTFPEGEEREQTIPMNTKIINTDVL